MFDFIIKFFSKALFLFIIPINRLLNVMDNFWFYFEFNPEYALAHELQ